MLTILQQLILLSSPWQCEKCTTINNALNKRCIYCWLRLAEETKAPKYIYTLDKDDNLVVRFWL